MEEQEYALGPWEFACEFTKDGKKHVAISTPSMWAKAYEYGDSLAASCKHSGSFCGDMMEGYLHLLMAKNEGLWESDAHTPADIFEMRNALTPVDVSDRYRKKGTEDKVEEGEEAAIDPLA